MHSGDGEEGSRPVVEATVDQLRRAACERLVTGIARESCSGTGDAVRCGRAVRLSA
jgi:hypothetical protein